MRPVLMLLAVAVLPLLHGCAVVALGGAAATGYAVGQDRRTVGVLTEDQSIEFKAINRISETYKGAHVNVTSYNRAVLLTGEAPDEAAKADMARIARSVENVREVYNELQVGPPSALQARASDSYTTSVVKARFVDAGLFSPLHVKVVTEAGVVYLMGLVNRKEADDATEITRTTRGVQKVVRLFEYVN